MSFRVKLEIFLRNRNTECQNNCRIFQHYLHISINNNCKNIVILFISLIFQKYSLQNPYN